MSRHIAYLLTILAIVLISGCRQRGNTPSVKEAVPQPAEEDHAVLWKNSLSSLVAISTFDGQRILESGHGFFVDSQLVVSRLSFFTEANRAMIFPYDGEQGYEVEGFVTLDRISDLIVLKVAALKRPPLKLFQDTIPNGAKSILVSKPSGPTLQLRSGEVQAYTVVNGLPLYQVSNQVLRNSFGIPVFLSNREVLGLAFSDVVDYKQRNLVVPGHIIAAALSRGSGEVVKPLAETRSQADRKTAEANSRIRGILISTDMGDITIRMFNEMPEYRDNFIRLAEEGFYDSLLIHRVIPGFGIQSGAADTRYAGKDDVVGWKGPGYTLPAHITPGKFHRRGSIGSPRKPDRDNSRKRSDGSQYYIVSGRTYNDTELNDIEKETGHRFTAEQRAVYKTQGGAPHLDGSYTLFGEVVSGMDVVDRIAGLEVGREFRPLNDIRVRKVKVLR